VTEPETIKCTRCRVDVLVAKLNPPAPEVRCTDWRCPLNTPEENARLKESAERARA
jgi:hypothetical protein